MSRLAAIITGLAVVIGVLAVAVAHPGEPAVPVRMPAYHPVTLDSRLKQVAVIGDSYTAGTDEGGLGAKSWTARAWQSLAAGGVRIAAHVAAEGRAGYGTRGDQGSVFEDLAARVAKTDDALVVFFGSRNDQGVDLEVLAVRVRDTVDLVRRLAPSAKLLMIGPPWPTADAPESMLHIRDVLGEAARNAGAAFVDPIGEGWFVDRPDLIGADGVHPNDAGHEYLADKIAPLIRAELAS